MKNRMQWLDTLKGLGIIFIITIHSTGDKKIYSFLQSFAVPLFFFVSGFLFNKSNDAGWPEFFFKRLKTRMIPYVIWFAIFYFIVMVANSRSIGAYITYFANLATYDSIISFVMGDFYWLTSTIHNGPLWFLPCLFLVENMFYYLSRISSTLQIGLILIAFSCSANVILFSTTWNLPYIVIMAVVQVLFYGFGFIANKLSENSRFPQNKIQILSLWILFCLISIWGGVSLDVSPTDRFTFVNYIYRTIIAFSGIFTYAIFAKYIEGWDWLRYIGANTLIIFLLNIPLHQVSNKLFFLINFKLFDSFFNNYRELFTLLQVITVLLLSVPCIVIINNYLPFLIIKKRIPSLGNISAQKN